MVRRKLFVSRPSVWNLENFNSRLPDRCLELGGKPHHAKDEEEAVLFAEDRGALLPLPGKRFDVVTWRRMRTDKYGVVTLDGRHRCSTDGSHARRDVLVGLRALEIEILDAGEPGWPCIRGRTARPAPAARTRPCSWRCSATGRTRGATASCATCRPTRCANGSTGRTRGNGAAPLQTLKRVDGESGWANAVEAMLATLESTGGVGRAGVTLLAARLAEGVERVEYEDDRPDLSEYDIAFTATDAEGGE